MGTAPYADLEGDVLLGPQKKRNPLVLVGRAQPEHALKNGGNIMIFESFCTEMVGGSLRGLLCHVV